MKSKNEKLWIICGMCGSGDVTVKINKDYHDIDGDNFKDGVVFSCANCGTIFDDYDVNEVN